MEAEIVLLTYIVLELVVTLQLCIGTKPLLVSKHLKQYSVILFTVGCLVLLNHIFP